MMLSRLRYWVRAMVRRSALEREMRDEMQLHLDRQTELLVARGMSRADARAAARREFGNVGMHQEDARDARPARWIDSVGADVRFAFRFFARKPLSSATIVLALAFGIGGSAALFSFVQSAIMRPLPGVLRDVPLVLVLGTVREKEQPRPMPMRFSYTALREMSNLRTIFSAVAGWTESNVVVDGPGALDHAATQVHFVTDGYFSVIGLRPAHGSGVPATDPNGGGAGIPFRNRLPNVRAYGVPVMFCEASMVCPGFPARMLRNVLVPSRTYAIENPPRRTVWPDSPPSLRRRPSLKLGLQVKPTLGAKLP